MAMAYTLTSSLLTDVHRDSSNHENRLAARFIQWLPVTGTQPTRWLVALLDTNLPVTVFSRALTKTRNERKKTKANFST